MAKNEERRDTQKRVDLLKAEQQLQTNLSALLKDQYLSGFKDLQNKKLAHSLQADAVKSVQEAKSIEDKLTAVLAAKQKIVEELWDTERDVAKGLLKKLETQEKLIKTEKGRKELSAGIKDIGEDIAKDLGGMLGISGELVSAFIKMGKAAILLVILKEVVTYFIDMVKSGVELNKTMGLNTANAFEFQKNIQLARASFDMLGYSAEEFNAAAHAMSELTGNINIPPDTIRDVTVLTGLLGDASAAAGLKRTLNAAGVDAGDLTDKVKKMANSLGMDAGPAMEYLAENQLELGGLTEDQMILRAKEGLMMKEMGADMKKVNDLASSALDIEKSLKDEMKLRMITGKNISLNELRAAQASGNAMAVAQAQKNLIASLGDDLHSNLQVQRFMTEATGMGVEQMLNYDNAGKINKKTQEKLLAIKKEHGFADIEQAKQFQTQMATKAAEAKASSEQWAGYWEWAGDNIHYIVAGVGTAILAVGALMWATAGRQNPVSSFMQSMGGKGVLKGAANSIVAAAAMVVIAGAMWVLGKALQEFNDVDFSSFIMAGIAIGGLTLVLAGLAWLGPVVLVGAAAMVIMAASVYGLGLAFQLFKPGTFDGMGEGLPILTSLIMLIPGLVGLSITFIALGASLLTLAVGLAAVSMFLPVLGALGFAGGDGGEESGTTTASNGMSELISEMKGLRRDIQTQPIMITVDGKVVSAISKVQNRQNSVRTAGYGR